MHSCLKIFFAITKGILIVLQTVSFMLDCMQCTEGILKYSMLFSGESDNRNLANLEELVWDPSKSPDDKTIDSFLVIARFAQMTQMAALMYFLLWFSILASNSIIY